MPSEVRILPSPPTYRWQESGNSSVGRARAFQARGRGFESRFPLQPNRSGEEEIFLDGRFAHVAQSVEHFLGKEEVAGSIPAVGFENERKRASIGARGKIENSHGSNQGIDRIGVRRLQAAQLYDHPEQEEAD